MDTKLAHLNMLQGVINRMAGNSFNLKGWSVVLISAIFALATAQAAPAEKVALVWLAYFPALAFWVLDGFFLHQEMLYRKLYSDVTKKTEDQIDFSMDTRPYRQQVASWLAVCLSTTLLIFHGMVVGTIGVVLILVK